MVVAEEGLPVGYVCTVIECGNGASRWLDTNMLAGISMSSAMAKAITRVCRFIGFLFNVKFVDCRP